MRLSLSLAGIAFLLLPFLSPAHGASQAQIQQQFRQWLENDLWPEAEKNGVSRGTFDAALGKVTVNLKLPDLVMPGEKPKPERPQAQAEFRSPAAYFNEGNIKPLVQSGRGLYREYGRVIAKIEKKYGVPGRIILAIWGRETGFGKVNLPYNAFEVLGTKAFLSTRKELFRKEVLAGLMIVEKGYASPDAMKSSWAGAMGQPQFMPSSYLKYAVDFDGDGHPNIWSSVPDTMASIANYLVKYGWQRGRDWGYEANIPQSVSCTLEGPDRMKPIAEWVAAGVTRINGKAFAADEMSRKAAILLPAGRLGPVFIATPNFYVIKEYNNSDLYALFIGNVANRIAFTDAPFETPFQPVGGLKRGEVMAMQKKLVAEGNDVGTQDGLAGFKTRRSIGKWQEQHGETATCFPSEKLYQQMK